jgi:hypothetical protein
MRALKQILASLFVIIIACIALAGCISDGDWSLNYGKTAEDGAWQGCLDTKHNRAFVTLYTWDGSEEGRRIEPTSIVGCKVIKYGGYFGRGLPCPFYLGIEGGSTVNLEEIPEDVEIEDSPFTLVVGPKITDFLMGYEDFYYRTENEDGTDSYYHAVFDIELDNNNPYFTIKDGLLYKGNEEKPVFDGIPARYSRAM